MNELRHDFSLVTGCQQRLNSTYLHLVIVVCMIQQCWLLSRKKQWHFFQLMSTTTCLYSR